MAGRRRARPTRCRSGSSARVRVRKTGAPAAETSSSRATSAPKDECDRRCHYHRRDDRHQNQESALDRATRLLRRFGKRGFGRELVVPQSTVGAQERRPGGWRKPGSGLERLKIHPSQLVRCIGKAKLLRPGKVHASRIEYFHRALKQPEFVVSARVVGPLLQPAVQGRPRTLTLTRRGQDT